MVINNLESEYHVRPSLLRLGDWQQPRGTTRIAWSRDQAGTQYSRTNIIYTRTILRGMIGGEGQS